MNIWMASKRRLRRKSCEGKIHHKSEDDARVAIKESMRAGFSGKLRYYKCQCGRGFPIGHLKHWRERRANGDFNKREFQI